MKGPRRDPASASARLEQLDTLKAAGLVSEEEYRERRSKILKER